MSIEEAKASGWKVYKADQSEFDTLKGEIIWCIEHPAGRIWNISGHVTNDEQSMWEHAHQHFINRTPALPSSDT